MREEKKYGIVVKRFLPRAQKIALFDRTLGLIEAVPALAIAHRLCHGAYISYHARAYKNVYFLEQVDIIHVPFAWARHDILFLHHVLELAYFFLSPRNPQASIFDLIYSLYRTADCSERMVKKIFLVRFFLLLGIYPEHEEKSFIALLKIINNSVDGIGGNNIDLDVERRIDAWLLSCTRMHLYGEYFKTIYFLMRDGGRYEKP